ncbi:MAG: uncharacterized protein A8A55_0503 [Amphiamblys sp. WSBS2006]|nr:MAG: uncharacterized protein A8A55_0503 [Amphiamblys sp. WSBS2006]
MLNLSALPLLRTKGFLEMLAEESSLCVGLVVLNREMALNISSGLYYEMTGYPEVLLSRKEKDRLIAAIASSSPNPFSVVLVTDSRKEQALDMKTVRVKSAEDLGNVLKEKNSDTVLWVLDCPTIFYSREQSLSKTAESVFDAVDKTLKENNSVFVLERPPSLKRWQLCLKRMPSVSFRFVRMNNKIKLTRLVNSPK